MQPVSVVLVLLPFTVASLLPRADLGLCSDPTSIRCPSAQNFCCPSSTECIPLDSGLSMICCPLGQQCDQIKPVSCPIASSSITPDSSLLCGTTNDLCCPIGFACGADRTKCIMKPENRPAHYTTPAIPSATATATSSPAPTIPASKASAKAKAKEMCEEYPAKAVLIGLIPGFLGGCIFGYLLFRIIIPWLTTPKSSSKKPHPDDHYSGPKFPFSAPRKDPGRMARMMSMSRRNRSIKSFLQPDPNPPVVHISPPVLFTSAFPTPPHPTPPAQSESLGWTSSSPMTSFGPYSARSRGQNPPTPIDEPKTPHVLTTRLRTVALVPPNTNNPRSAVAQPETTWPSPVSSCSATSPQYQIKTGGVAYLSSSATPNLPGTWRDLTSSYGRDEDKKEKTSYGLEPRFPMRPGTRGTVTSLGTSASSNCSEAGSEGSSMWGGSRARGLSNPPPPPPPLQPLKITKVSAWVNGGSVGSVGSGRDGAGYGRSDGNGGYGCIETRTPGGFV